MRRSVGAGEVAFALWTSLVIMKNGVRMASNGQGEIVRGGSKKICKRVLKKRALRAPDDGGGGGDVGSLLLY